MILQKIYRVVQEENNKIVPVQCLPIQLVVPEVRQQGGQDLPAVEVFVKDGARTTDQVVPFLAKIGLPGHIDFRVKEQGVFTQAEDTFFPESFNQEELVGFVRIDHTAAVTKQKKCPH
jgi:hypothetical protein